MRRRGDGLVLPILIAEPADPRDGGHALLKACEAAGAAVAGTILRAPRHILRLGARPGARHNGENSEHEQRKSHSRVLVLQWLSAINTEPPWVIRNFRTISG
jgi:hypothetical protein